MQEQKAWANIIKPSGYRIVYKLNINWWTILNGFLYTISLGLLATLLVYLIIFGI